MATFSIITPCRNAEKYIAETMISVMSQPALSSGEVSLDYIICDGNSSDRTVEIAEELARNYEYGKVRIISRPDTGMYDALASGLRRAEGDYCAYINAGDFYSPHAFEIVHQVFQRHGDDWLTGFAGVYNDHSQLVQVLLPYRFRRRLIQVGRHGRLGLPTIQQESTFWRADLNDELDLEELASYKLAGDYYLWKTFSEKHDLKIVAAHLGGFRHHAGQLSTDLKGYLLEQTRATGGRRANLFDHAVGFADTLCWHLSDPLKKFLNKKGIYRFDFEQNSWR